MIVIERVVSGIVDEMLKGKERDTLRLTWEERRWGRRRLTTVKGREVALALPTGSVLRAGQILAVEPEWYLEVESAPEPVIAVFPRDHAEALRLAFEVGNRHFSLALEPDALLVPDDPAMEQLLTRLGAKWERRTVIFNPIGAAHAHEH
ncbi:MAG: urease accessory protein UreE [candidate division NC10 bacterium]